MRNFSSQASFQGLILSFFSIFKWAFWYIFVLSISFQHFQPISVFLLFDFDDRRFWYWLMTKCKYYKPFQNQDIIFSLIRVWILTFSILFFIHLKLYHISVFHTSWFDRNYYFWEYFSLMIFFLQHFIIFKYFSLYYFISLKYMCDDLFLFIYLIHLEAYFPKFISLLHH